MIKVLLADDNKISLKYFSELICWEDYGYELVSAAVDGENAWYDFQKYRPQVVIMDIQMPMISGIELAERILNVSPRTVILFLSSYSEFQYARAAVKLQVNDYLLKHETTKETLVGKLEEIREHLEHEKEKQRLLVKEEITSLFLQNRREKSGMKGAENYLNNRYDCFFLEMEHEFTFLTRTLREYRRNYAVREKRHAVWEDSNCAAHTVSEHVIRHCCSSFSNYIALVSVTEFEFLLVTTPTENPFDFCCRFQRTIREATEQYCSVVILQKNQPIHECASFWNKVKPFLKQIYFYPQAAIIEGTYLTASSATVTEEDLNRMSHRIDRNTLTIMEQIYRKITEAKDYACFCHAAEEWMKILLSYDRRMIDPSTGQIVTVFTNDEIPKACDIDVVYNWIRQKFVKLTDILASINFAEISNLVREAVFLISSHYSNYDLNVEWIAEKLKVSPSNLNMQFKKETGYTPWKVIVNTRLSIARKLLDEGIETPNQICFKTGYNSLSYFSKAFKKAYGMSPQEYRRKKE